MASPLLVLQAVSATSSNSAGGERAAWIEKHKVGWRLGPLREYVQRHGVVQTGYELVLFGRFHPNGRDDYEAARTLHEGLRALALEALGPGPLDFVLSVLPINRVVVLADNSKFTTPNFCTICRLADIHQIITDDGIDQANLTNLRTLDVNVRVVRVSRSGSSVERS